jgi:lipopolysaccharide transport system permease protein
MPERARDLKAAAMRVSGDRAAALSAAPSDSAGGSAWGQRATHLRWRYRSLLFNLVMRDLKVRYRGSVLGFAWTFLNPLLMTGVFTLVFTQFMVLPDPGVPFPAFLLVGLLAWNFCYTAVFGSLWSLVSNASLVNAVSIPRWILTLAAVLSATANFVLALAVLLPVLTLLGTPPGWTLVFFPLVLLIQVIFLLGLGLILATLNVFFRDTGPIMEVVAQLWFFLTPVFYDLQNVHPQPGLAPVVAALPVVNPMAALVILYREILLYGHAPEPLLLLRTLAICLGMLALGCAFFRRLSARIGDEL